MSVSPVIALAQGDHCAPRADCALVAALGGAKIFDEAPQRAGAALRALRAKHRRATGRARCHAGAEQIIVLSVVSVQRGLARRSTLAEQHRGAARRGAADARGHHAHRPALSLHGDAARAATAASRASTLRFRATTEQLINGSPRWPPRKARTSSEDQRRERRASSPSPVCARERLALNADTVDVTDAEFAGRWRELLAGAGVERASVPGTGIFKDSTSDALLRQAVLRRSDARLADRHSAFRQSSRGLFQIVSLDYRGEHASGNHLRHRARIRRARSTSQRYEAR